MKVSLLYFFLLITTQQINSSNDQYVSPLEHNLFVNLYTLPDTTDGVKYQIKSYGDVYNSSDSTISGVIPVLKVYTTSEDYVNDSEYLTVFGTIGKIDVSTTHMLEKKNLIKSHELLNHLTYSLPFSVLGKSDGIFYRFSFKAITIYKNKKFKNKGTILKSFYEKHNNINYHLISNNFMFISWQ